MAVTEVNARYHRPAVYDDEVRVIVCLEQLQSRGMTFSYEVRRASDGELLVSGMTKHISVDKRGQVIRISGAFREKLLAGARRLERGA